MSEPVPSTPTITFAEVEPEYGHVVIAGAAADGNRVLLEVDGASQGHASAEVSNAKFEFTVALEPGRHTLGAYQQLGAHGPLSGRSNAVEVEVGVMPRREEHQYSDEQG